MFIDAFLRVGFNTQEIVGLQSGVLSKSQARESPNTISSDSEEKPRLSRDASDKKVRECVLEAYFLCKTSAETVS